MKKNLSWVWWWWHTLLFLAEAGLGYNRPLAQKKKKRKKLNLAHVSVHTSGNLKQEDLGTGRMMVC